MTDYKDESYDWSKTDRLYDEMRDDFLTIQNEAGAIACIMRYPSVAEHYLPKEYKHLLKEKN